MALKWFSSASLRTLGTGFDMSDWQTAKTVVKVKQCAIILGNIVRVVYVLVISTYTNRHEAELLVWVTMPLSHMEMSGLGYMVPHARLFTVSLSYPVVTPVQPRYTLIV